jgi:hypothetical protein
MTHFAYRWWSAMALLGLSGELIVAADSAPRPHIVLIVADDMGYADPGFNGGKEL